MPKTIVGLFPSASEAQNVKHELVDQGYSASSIQVMANDGSSAMGGDSVASDRTDEETGWGREDQSLLSLFDRWG